jgi:hypothetical protein
MEVDSNGGVYLLTPRDEKRKLTVTYVGFTGNRMNSQDRKYVAAARISNEFMSRPVASFPKAPVEAAQWRDPAGRKTHVEIQVCHEAAARTSQA